MGTCTLNPKWNPACVSKSEKHPAMILLTRPRESEAFCGFPSVVPADQPLPSKCTEDSSFFRGVSDYPEEL